MTKNVTVFDSEGKIIGKTYPKRAAGLVKNGRARFYDSAESAIILARSPDMTDTSEEDEIMSNINNDEIRERIETMLREAREKLEAVCGTAAEAIDELVNKIDDAEEGAVTNDDGDTIIHVSSEDGDGENTDGSDEPGDVLPEGNGQPVHRRFVRISDEDMEKLKEKMRSLRVTIGKVTDEAKTVAVRTGAELGKYAETVKTKVAEKLAEREAEEKAKAEVENPGSEAYYLRRIEEIQRDTTHVATLQSAVSELAFASGADNGLSDAVSDIATAAMEHESTNRKLLDFYIHRLELLRHEHE